jgi:hypothetical protein
LYFGGAGGFVAYHYAVHWLWRISKSDDPTPNAFAPSPKPLQQSSGQIAPVTNREKLAILCVLLGLSGAAWLALQGVGKPRLNVYGHENAFCDEGPISKDPAAIPWIGCFSLSAGHRAKGEFYGQHMEVAVGLAGYEVFTVNGTLAAGEYDSNFQQRVVPPFFRVGNGYAFCRDAASTDCPTLINVFSRNSDKSVLFMVAECLPPKNHICVLNRKNWNYENSHRR